MGTNSDQKVWSHMPSRGYNELICCPQVTHSLEGRKRSFSPNQEHWGWTHEGVGRHPRQDGGGLSHRLGKLQANLQTQRIYWSPILIEVIVTGTRNIGAEFQVVIGSQSAVIPTWKVFLVSRVTVFHVEGDATVDEGDACFNWSNGDGHITLSFQKQGVAVNGICWQWFIMLKFIRCE